MVFKQPRVRCFHMPAPLDDVEQIDCCKPLGVMFQSNFKMDSHVNYLLSQCAQRMYILSSGKLIVVRAEKQERYETFRRTIGRDDSYPVLGRPNPNPKSRSSAAY